MTRYIQAYENELDYFIQSLMHNSNIHPNGHDGLNALIIAEAAYSSLKSGKNIYQIYLIIQEHYQLYFDHNQLSRLL